MGSPDLEHLVDDAVGQVRDALAKVVGDVGRVLGFGGREPSPYIVLEKDVGSRVRGQYIRCGILLFVTLIFLASAVEELGSPVALVISLVLAALHARWGIRHYLRGRHEQRLADVLAGMSRELGTTERASLAELARTVDVPTKELEPLVAEAIDRGLIPEGHLASREGAETLYLTAASWEADQALEEARREEPGGAEGDALPDDAARVVEACRSFCATAAHVREDIRDADVTSTLGGIAKKVERIARYVERHPETAPQLRKLVTYYLPTTAKLASSYAELEGAGDGPEAASTRDELRETLGLVDAALGRLSDSLLQDQSWDLKSDMDVMRSMLEQDGLSGGDSDGRG